MRQPTSPTDTLQSVEFQVSLLHIGSLGAKIPQAEELESLLVSQVPVGQAILSPASSS